MSIDLIGIEVNSERRLRLTFSNALAAGAFATPGPSYYVISVATVNATAPTVKSAMIVSGAPNQVELALSNDLVRGIVYTLSAVGVPATDATATPVGTTTPFQRGAVANNRNVEPVVRDYQRSIFGVDLIWNGSDYEELPNGDLARVEGTANVTKALWRSIETTGLPWNPTWGINSRDWVDSPSPAGSSLRGALVRQIRKDPRVTSVTADITQTGNQTYISITPTLISGLTIDPVSTPVYNGS